MSNINPIMNDRVRFTLEHDDMGNLLLMDSPIGWNTDEKEYARHEEYNGIFPKFSNSLKFVGDGADFINMIVDLYGVNSNVRLTKDEKHPQTDHWTRLYEGYLDLSTWEYSENQVSVKFNSGGLEEILKARESEDVELSRLTTMDGVAMEPLKTEIVKYNGRKIFLKSKWGIDPENADDVDISAFSNSGGVRNTSEGYPFEKLIYKSHEEAQEVSFDSQGNTNVGSGGMMLINVVDRQRTFVVKGENITLKPFITRFDATTGFFKVSLTIFENGTDYDVKERLQLIHYGANNDGQAYDNNNNLTLAHNKLFTLNFNEIITLEADESLALEFLIQANLTDGTEGGSRFTVKVRERGGFLYLDEDSFFKATKSKFVLAHEAAVRLLQIITNKTGIFKSNFLGRTDIGYEQDGTAAYNGLSHGHWVRGFDELPAGTEDNPNLFKPLTTSFKDFVTAFNAVWNLGLGIERVGFKERIVLEDLTYFYNRNVTIRLPNQVKAVKRTFATKYIYSSIDVGYEKGGVYSEAMGLDEYNGKSTFNTVITKVRNAFSKISPYIAASYAKEFARRKQFENFPTEDTQYDEDIFLQDLKRGPSSIFLERLWQDDFAQKPTGTYNPESATNLRLSPFNMLLRHGWEIAAGLIKNPLDYIRYGSSTGNSKLKTQLIGGNEYAEDGNIINSELPKARYQAMYIEFEHELDFELLQLIEGYQMIEGERIYNIYGLIEFINEDNITERGWLINLKPNEKGKWKLLVYNKI